MLGRELRTFLLADNTISGLVSTRVYEDVVPKSNEVTGVPAMPYVWLQRSGITHELALAETTGGDPWKESYQVECVATSANNAQTLGDAVYSRLSDYQGTVGTKYVGLLDIVEYQNSYVQEVPAGDLGRFVAILTVVIHGAR